MTPFHDLKVLFIGLSIFFDKNTSLKGRRTIGILVFGLSHKGRPCRFRLTNGKAVRKAGAHTASIT
jgi:hypothetical protein